MVNALITRTRLHTTLILINIFLYKSMILVYKCFSQSDTIMICLIRIRYHKYIYLKPIRNLNVGKDCTHVDILLYFYRNYNRIINSLNCLLIKSTRVAVVCMEIYSKKRLHTYSEATTYKDYFVVTLLGETKVA